MFSPPNTHILLWNLLKYQILQNQTHFVQLSLRKTLNFLQICFENVSTLRYKKESDKKEITNCQSNPPLWQPGLEPAGLPARKSSKLN